MRRFLIIACVVYAFVALKKAYRQSIGATLAKGLLLSFGYTVLLSIGLALTLVATVFLF